MAVIKFDIKQSKSFKILPKKDRRPIKDIESISESRTRKALSASEKELKHVMNVANIRAERIDHIAERYVDQGMHLADELFIPQYLGFEFITDKAEDCSTIQIFSKEGYNLSRVGDELYLVLCPSGQKPVVRIRNMYEGIFILAALGVNLDFETFMAGEYTQEKTLIEIRDTAINKVIEDRIKAEKDV